jgi:hypothetical protein
MSNQPRVKELLKKWNIKIENDPVKVVGQHIQAGEVFMD